MYICVTIMQSMTLRDVWQKGDFVEAGALASFNNFHMSSQHQGQKYGINELWIS